MSTNPNSALSLLHRATTLRDAWQAPINDRVAFLRSMCAGKNVLDIGCVAHEASRMESPSWLHRHLADVAATCVGVDVDRLGIEAMTRAGFVAIKHDLELGLGPLKRYGPFDVIVAGELVEHVESLGMVFRTARAALAPHGVLVITTPNPYAPWRVRAGQRGVIWENTDHICYFFPSGVAELAERHGLRLRHAMTVERPVASSPSDLLRRIVKTIRGRQWADVGWRSTGKVTSVRLESRSAKALRTFLPRRGFRLTGETFVYVVECPLLEGAHDE